MITDAGGRIEWVNEGFSRMTDYAPDEVRGRKPGEFLQGPDTDQAVVERIRGHLAAREPFREQLVNYSKSGRQYWVEMEVQPVIDDDGTLTNFMAIESDITPDLAALQRIRVADERFRVLFEASPIGLALLDLDGSFMHANQAFLDIVGLSYEELSNGASPTSRRRSSTTRTCGSSAPWSVPATADPMRRSTCAGTRPGRRSR